MTFLSEKPIGIFYPFPEDHNPLLHSLRRDGIPFIVINPEQHSFEFKNKNRDVDFSLLYNDLSTPKGFVRDPDIVNHLNDYLKHLQSNDLRLIQGRMINGPDAVESINNRIRQVSIFSSLSLPFPKTTVVNHVDRLMSILPDFTFPVLLKPKETWKDSAVYRFNSPSALLNAVLGGRITLSGSILLQEYHETKNRSIVRAETVNGRFVHANKVFTLREPEEQFPLEWKSEAYTPSIEIIEAVEKVVRAAKIDIGAVEYFTSSKDNKIYFYSLRPFTNSNVTASGTSGVASIVSYLKTRLGKIHEMELSL
jgi:hypothetical protein